MRTVLQAVNDFWTGLLAGQINPLGAWNYLLLAILVALEGPVVTLLGAALSASGLLRPQWVFAAAAAGNLTSDALWYTLGSLGKTEWLLRHGQRFGLRPDHVQRLEAQMHRHSRRILIVAKLTLSFSIPALIAAGMARVPWKRWFSTVATAEFVWTGGLVVAGYYFSRYLRKLELGLQIVAIAGVVIVVALGIRYLAHKGKHYEIPSD